MATLTLRCKCGKMMSVPDEHRGAKIRCRQCGIIQRVPPLPHASPARPQQAGGVWTLRNVALLLAGIVRWVAAWFSTDSSWTLPKGNWRAILAPGIGGFVARLSWLYLGVMIIAAVLLWQTGDAWWPITVLLFIGRWVFLAPVGILACAAAVVRRRALIPLAGALVVVAFPIMGFQTGWRRLIPHPQGLHVRAVSFNADGGTDNWVHLQDFLATWKPDVMAIEECGEAMQNAVHGLVGFFTHSANAVCFISRFPIVDSAVMNRGTLERIHGQNDEGIGGAGYVTRYVVRTPRGPINVTALHLETPRKGLENLLSSVIDHSRLDENTALRSIESGLARAWVDRGTYPTVVMGDFNTPVESQIFQKSWGSLTDAFSHAGFGLGMTKFNGWIRVRIDHVLTGPGWYADRVRIGDDLASDHRPLIVDLTLAP